MRKLNRWPRVVDGIRETPVSWGYKLVERLPGQGQIPREIGRNATPSIFIRALPTKRPPSALTNWGERVVQSRARLWHSLPSSPPVDWTMSWSRTLHQRDRASKVPSDHALLHVTGQSAGVAASMMGPEHVDQPPQSTSTALQAACARSGSPFPRWW